jgi:peptidoglycan hydrolase-like protein with peptidoglycan-binding domain
MIKKTMIRQIRLFLFGAALFMGGTALSAAAVRPAAAQATSSAAKKKKKSASTSSTSAKSSSTKSTSAKTVSTKSKGKSRSKVAAKPKGQGAPTSDRIKEIQTALQKDGSYNGEPTGKWDSATTDAMRKYQDKNGVNPTGKIDAVSLNKMGLGSETAGKGAPVAPSSRSSAPAPAPRPSASASPTSE